MTTFEETTQKLQDSPRTWLITGIAGFIGSNLAEALLKLNQRVIGLDNFSTGHHANLEQVQQAVTHKQWWRLRFVEGDIRSAGTCRQVCASADFVLHHAALGSVPQSLADPVACHASNVNGFLNMLMGAREAGVSRFVYASSSATYGDHPGLPQVETHIGRALSPYAVSKHVNELYADIFARCYGMQSIGLRYFNVFGPRQDPAGAYAAVIPKWAAAMIRNEPVHINGDGETMRDFCYVENVVQANLLAATVENAEAVNQVYNIALNEGTTLNQLFETMRALLAPHFPHLNELRPVYRDFAPGDVRLSRADIAKACALLSYQPAWRASDGLARTMDWYVGRLPRGEVLRPRRGQVELHES